MYDLFEIKNKSQSMKFNVKYEYVINQVNDTELIITDQSINESYTVPIKSIKANFIHGYCRTCHSLQGSSISREITICVRELFYTSRKWIYTVVARATDLKTKYMFITVNQKK